MGLAQPTSAGISERRGSGAPLICTTKLAMYERMLLIRGVEERLVRNFKEGVLPGNVHLYIGEEAVAVGVCAI